MVLRATKKRKKRIRAIMKKMARKGSKKHGRGRRIQIYVRHSKTLQRKDLEKIRKRVIWISGEEHSPGWGNSKYKIPL